MKIHQFGVAAASAALAFSFAGAASAQASRPAAAAASATSVPTGPAIPGVCTFSKGGLVQTSIVGKYVISRLQQLQAQVEAELSAEQTQFDVDAKAFQAKRGKVPDAQLQPEALQLQARQVAFQRKYQLRGQEMTATQEKAVQHVLVESEPLLRSAFLQRSCSLLLDRDALIFPAPSMDITGMVAQGLDAKIQQFPFDREHLDQQAATGGR